MTDVDTTSATPEIEVGMIICDKTHRDEIYRVKEISRPTGGINLMIYYEGEFGDGEILANHFHKAFDIIQGKAILKVTTLGVDCPHCDSWIAGFIRDPRGMEVECEHCSRTFLIDKSEVIFN